MPGLCGEIYFIGEKPKVKIIQRLSLQDFKKVFSGLNKFRVCSFVFKYMAPEWEGTYSNLKHASSMP